MAGSAFQSRRQHALTTGGDNTTTAFAGTISGGSGSLVKTGSGMFTLSGANTYSGPTAITAGTLAITGAGVLGGSSGRRQL